MKNTENGLNFSSFLFVYAVTGFNGLVTVENKQGKTESKDGQLLVITVLRIASQASPSQTQAQTTRPYFLFFFLGLPRHKCTHDRQPGGDDKGMVVVRGVRR
jgi:hypothetical protein